MSTDAEAGSELREGSDLSGDETGRAKDEDESEDTAASGSMRADWMDALRDVAPYLDLGWRIAGAAAIPPIVGWGIDVWLETLPWGVSVGALLGLVTAAVQLRQVGDELDTRSAASKASRPDAEQTKRGRGEEAE